MNSIRLGFACMLALFAGQAMAQGFPADTPVAVQALQLANGKKEFRFSTRIITHENAEASLNDLIAQGLANAHWCPDGWEVRSRSTPTRGFWLVEGFCK